MTLNPTAPTPLPALANPADTARRIGGPLTVFEEDTRIHGRHQDFTVWHAR